MEFFIFGAVVVIMIEIAHISACLRNIISGKAKIKIMTVTEDSTDSKNA